MLEVTARWRAWRPGFPALSAHQRAILLAASAANALFFFEQTGVTTALGTIQRDLHASAAEGQWVIGAYLLPLAALMAASGRLGDLWGPRRLFLGGILLFGLAAIACAAAPTPWALIGARVAMGAGAALATPIATAAVVSAFPRERRGWAIGVLATGGTIFLSVGPLAGGLIAQEASWRWIFVALLPIVVLAAVTGARSLERRSTGGRNGVDWLGLGLLALGLTALVSGLLQAGPWEWDDPRTLALLGGGVALLVAFVLVERRVETPFVDLRLLGLPRVRAGLLALATIQFAIIGVTIYAPLYLHLVLGYSPVVAGLLFLPAVVATPLFSPLTGRLVDRSGARWLVSGGLAVAAAGLFYLALVAGDEEIGFVVPALLLFGASRPLVITPASRAAIDAVPEEKHGLASGLVTSSRQIGAVLGVAILAAVVASVEASRRTALLPDTPAIDRSDTRSLDAILSGQDATSDFVPLIPLLPDQDLRGVLGEAFTSGLSTAFIVAGALAAAVAVVVAIWLRFLRVTRTDGARPLG
jgi:EmrB/QacA subfamily drug resistance transporter